MDGQDVDGVWDFAFHWRGIRSDSLQQHHGFPATGLRICECAALCNLPVGYVLEANDGARCIYGLARRNDGRRGASWIDVAERSSAGNQGRMAGPAAYVSE